MSRNSTATRERILTAACALLERDDGNPVRMADIASAANLSRQAVYLHFGNRAELLIAAVRHRDKVADVDSLLAESRAADGVARLDAFIDAWTGHLPTIYPIARALMAMRETDSEAAAAFDDRMDAVRDGCRAAVEALSRNGELTADISVSHATDLLFTLMSIPTWQQLCRDFAWSQAEYVDRIRALAHAALRP